MYWSVKDRNRNNNIITKTNLYIAFNQARGQRRETEGGRQGAGVGKPEAEGDRGTGVQKGRGQGDTKGQVVQ